MITGENLNEWQLWYVTWRGKSGNEGGYFNAPNEVQARLSPSICGGASNIVARRIDFSPRAIVDEEVADDYYRVTLKALTRGEDGPTSRKAGDSAREPRGKEHSSG